MSRIRLLIVLALASSLGCDPAPDLEGNRDAQQVVAGGKADGLEGMVQPGWMGLTDSSAPARVQIERFASGDCHSGPAYLTPPTYDSWARQRATHRNLCFDVWAQGITDWHNPDLWQQLDARALTRWQGEDEPGWSWEWIQHVGFAGNNARYAFGLRPHDPFDLPSSLSCPDVPFEVENVDLGPEWVQASATLEVVFTINGAEHRPSPGATFEVRYTGVVSSSCVAPSP